MDSISGKLSFTIERLHVDTAYAPFQEDYQLMLGIVATFRISLNHKWIFEEPEFPVVEFAVQLASWFPDGLRANTAFIYTSMESEIREFLWFRSSEGDWKIGSDFAPLSPDTVVSEKDLESAVADFQACLLNDIPSELRTPVSRLLRDSV
ncbi:MAG: hypothetical protein IPJ30_10440 [Acidobacteria bacterium]|nr:hypothetical protein [Acidobacteriota bacterium]